MVCDVGGRARGYDDFDQTRASTSEPVALVRLYRGDEVTLVTRDKIGEAATVR
jgi:hypothetical protein